MEFGKGEPYYRPSLQRSSRGKYGLLLLSPTKELGGSRLQQLISAKWQPKSAQN